MRSKFVLRFDDMSPGMAWRKFAAFEQLADELRIPLLVGVVPDCHDKKLSVGPESASFWERVREWKAKGWTIAQHGYTHQYATKEAGILGINTRSEFAGRPAEEQFALLEAGKRIMSEQDVWQPVFMAPGHSFDMLTVESLAKLGFEYLTDGYGIYPYRIGGLVAVPQLFSGPMHFGFGIYTICLHVNSMTDDQIAEMLHYIRVNKERVISFDEAAALSCSLPGLAPGARLVTSALLKVVRQLRQRRVS